MQLNSDVALKVSTGRFRNILRTQYQVLALSHSHVAVLDESYLLTYKFA